MRELPPVAPPQMWIESASGRVHYPSPRQAAETARGLGDASGDFVALIVGDSAVVSMVNRAGGLLLEYGQAAGGHPYQARSVSLDDVVDAFERFAAGDSERNPRLRWTRVDPRLLPSLASGGQRLPEAFYDIAPRLRAGERPLDLRNEIMATTGLSRLAAAKRVEEVEKLLKAARAAIGSGLLFVGWLAFHVFNSGGLFGIALYSLLALGPFGFAWYIFRESRPPTD